MGTIDDLAQRLTRWGLRQTGGLLRVEYSSEFARQQVMQQVKQALQAQQISLEEISLPRAQPPETVVRFLLEALEQSQSPVVSVVGFASAFGSQVPLPDALRLFNFNRERFVAAGKLQIWWMTPNFLQTAIHAMPDLNSWFSQRLQLIEPIALPADASLAITRSGESTEGFVANLEDAKRRVYELLQRERAAQAAGASDLERLQTYILPALEALADVGAEQSLHDLTMQFEGLLNQLKFSNTPEIATSLGRLANLYAAQGRYSEAEPLYLQALEIRRSQLGAEHPTTATSLNNLAKLYRAQGRYSEAEPLFLDALNIKRRQLGAEHPSTALSLNNLAMLYDSQGRYSEAEPLFLDALNINRRQLGAEHPDTASSLNNLAALYHFQGRYGEAEPLFLDALNIRRSQLGAEHPSTATSLNNLALLYKSQGRYGEAEPLYLDALNIRRSQLGAEHPDTAQSLNNLANLYDSQGRYSEAELLYLDALNITRSQLGAEHPDTASSLNNLGAFYVERGNFEAAIPLLQQSLAICERVLGDSHPNTLVPRHWLERAQAGE
ncbi:MAG: tetratricopeptide repeat protein [Pegethrix bostrychoides GSE-TBD4-15B]|uniref:Tetratricopeptide repeat protein n=1 Tax=Pegethrix bostrychoides GSE-TBD4-15B TaxID=2839662 RepID=A0A951PDC8_9CYAN|nr:tetratricopeptide repeat protein [Pegethrix bostrychoides GSE-TBD4-15B]